MQTLKHYHSLEPLEHRVLLAHEGQTSSEATSFPYAVAVDLILSCGAMYHAVTEHNTLSAVMGVLLIAAAGLESANYCITSHHNITNASSIDPDTQSFIPQ